MNHVTEKILVAVADLAFYAGLPALMIWGWVRFSRRPRVQGLLPILSVLSLALATASTALAIGSVLYAHAIGGFPYYDPLLLRIYRWGALLSITALLFAMGGAWRRNPIRWHSLASSVVVLLFWFAAAEGE
jgi:hypothetical protein